MFHVKLVRKCAQGKRHLISVTKIKMLPEDDRQDGHQVLKHWAYAILRLSFTQNSTLIEEPCEKCTNYTSNNICTATHDTLRYVMRLAIIFIFFLTISVGHFGLSFSPVRSLALPPTDASFSQPTRENLDLHLVPVNEQNAARDRRLRFQLPSFRFASYRNFDSHCRSKEDKQK